MEKVNHFCSDLALLLFRAMNHPVNGLFLHRPTEVFGPGTGSTRLIKPGEHLKQKYHDRV